jgi:hypothetical protein
MDCSKKGIIRYVFCLSLALPVLFLLAVGTATAAAYRDQLPVPMSQIVWDHTNVSGWRVNSDLHSVYIEGGNINLPHTQACSWPMYDHAVNANAWVIHKESDGRWHANTWDFMRKCQTAKGEHDVGWGTRRPYSGQELYFLVSGIARPGYAETIQARSNIIKYIWHGAPGVPTPACSTTPVLQSFTATPTTVVGGLNKEYNVELNWEISNVEGLILEADNGWTGESTIDDPEITGVQLPIDRTHTFKLTAKGCTPESTWPSKTLTVEYRDPSMAGVNLLLLTDYGNAPTTD